MKEKKLPTKFAGVRYYEHATRKLKGGVLDRYYSIRFKFQGKLYEEALGWASDGWNPEKANAIRAQLRQAQKTGHGPKTLSDVRKINDEIKLREAQQSKAIEVNAMTLSEFFETHYMPHAKRSKRSWLTDMQRIEKFINPILGIKPLDKITKQDIQDFVDELAASGAAPATVKQYFTIIRRAFNMAAEIYANDGPLFTGSNPTKGVILPKVINARERFLSGDEVEQLIEEAKKLRSIDLHDAIVISLNTGLRLGEIRRLTWMDVDFTSNMLTVRDEVNRKPGGKIPINSKVKEIFISRKATAEITDLVFPPIYGKELRDNLSRDFKIVVDRLGLNKGLKADDRQRRIVFHTLRHTFASWLALAGVDIYRIKTLMRHKTLEMTMRYAHLIPDATHDAVQSLQPPKNV